jgi:putative ATP-dependent DNA ligase
MLPEPMQQALDHRKARAEGFAELRYLRVTDDFHATPRGTVLAGERLVYGYPHIGRILELETGLALQFEQPFWVEEKVDGYNVRVARLGERAVALTRGGFVCPFTTDRLADLADLRILDDHPDLVLCAEVAGPDQPYVAGHPPHVTEGVQLFAFDLMEVGRPGFLPAADRERLLSAYGLTRPQRFGRFAPADWRAIQALVQRLDRERREGVVMKEDSAADRRAKYVTASSCIDDIAAMVDNLLQLPPEYFTGRILRLALFLAEQGETGQPSARADLGRAFLDGLLGAIERFRHDHRVYRTHRCLFHDPANAHALMDHLRRAEGPVQVIQRGLTPQEDGWVLEFEKVYVGMTGLLGHLLRGGMVFD